MKKNMDILLYIVFIDIKESPVWSQNKWAQELVIQIDDWGYFYSSPFIATRNTKL
jgi:hypothetical protein